MAGSDDGGRAGIAGFMDDVFVLWYWRRRPYLLVGWFWFLGTLVPTIGLVQVGAQSMADRYTYIPSMGFFIMIVWGAADYEAAHPLWRKVSCLIAGGALAGCLLGTVIQIGYWRNSEVLFLHALAVSPDNYVAANSLGKAFEKAGDPGRALVMYRDSVELEPRYPQSQFNYALEACWLLAKMKMRLATWRSLRSWKQAIPAFNKIWATFLRSTTVSPTPSIVSATSSLCVPSRPWGISTWPVPWPILDDLRLRQTNFGKLCAGIQIFQRPKPNSTISSPTILNCGGNILLRPLGQPFRIKEYLGTAIYGKIKKMPKIVSFQAFAGWPACQKIEATIN